MKKFIIASLSLSLLLGACSNEKESATKIASSKNENKGEKKLSENSQKKKHEILYFI